MERLSSMRASWSLLTLGLAALIPMSSANAAIVYSATTGNSTAVGNLGATAFSGATPDLLTTNGPNASFMGGFASTDDINTLNGTALTAADTVTFAVTVDSLTGGQLRSNGVEFGMADTAAFRGGATTSNFLLRFLVDHSGASPNTNAGIFDSFQDDGNTGDIVTRASLEDGFSATLTANAAGYSFFVSDIITGTAATDLTLSGTFAGTEFLDNFSTGHFYAAVQNHNNGAITADYSLATIDVTSVPEPSSLALLCASGLMVVRRRRRS